VRDISQEAQLEQLRSDFINQAAHDLRTPITTTKLMVDLLRHGGSPEELEPYWGILENVLDRQQFLVERMLTVGRIDSNTLQLCPEAVELGPIIENIYQVYRHVAMLRNIKFMVDLAPDFPTATGDLTYLPQALINIVDNAMKFTTDGGTVSITATANPTEVLVHVKDTGSGIRAEDYTAIFNRYYRSQQSVKDFTPGTGVGLHISNVIVTGLGGRIEVQSVVGAGSTFTIYLPRQFPA
jgi:signal transduction histidine kinase